jgi:DNA repair photolyase
MNDPYMPIEKELQLTRHALEIIKTRHFPIHIITKSDLVTRYIDLLRDISTTYAAVSLTITTSDDKYCKIIEPGAPVSSARFKAIEKLAKNDIYCGVLISPVLPFITDTEKNIQELIQMAGNSGANYVLMWPGMTQRQGQREWYYEQLDKHFPELKEKYIHQFGNAYDCSSPIANKLFDIYQTNCKELGLETTMRFYKEPKVQTELF